MHTLVVWSTTIPACSQRLTKYLPRLAPVWGPDMARNAMTSETSDQLVGLITCDSIQWAVIPMKDAFIWSTDQRSVVVEMWPELLSLDFVFKLQASRGRIKKLTWTLHLRVWRKSTKELWIKVMMSWLEGMSALLVFGRIATKQFLNASLLATARLCQTMWVPWTQPESSLQHLIWLSQTTNSATALITSSLENSQHCFDAPHWSISSTLSCCALFFLASCFTFNNVCGSAWWCSESPHSPHLTLYSS